MQVTIENWKVQVKKGYLELCLLLLIRRNKRMYGLELLERLSSLELQLKEGTLYPLLNRLTEEGLLAATWETENIKGHPRKFYALTKRGVGSLNEMEEEFIRMIDLISKIKESR